MWKGVGFLVIFGFKFILLIDNVVVGELDVIGVVREMLNEFFY